MTNLTNLVIVNTDITAELTKTYREAIWSEDYDLACEAAFEIAAQNLFGDNELSMHWAAIGEMLEDDHGSEFAAIRLARESDQSEMVFASSRLI